MYKEYPKFTSDEVADYGRKSRTDDPLLSVEEVLAKHDAILNEYAMKYLGGPIPEENKYREIGSGESLKSRPEITKLLKRIESPAIKAILIVEVQRLSRGDLEDAGRLINILRYTNTYVITPHKIYDLRDEYDRDAFERELKRGNEYLEYTKKILARGRLASVKEGNYIGSTPPYGFDKATIECGNKICPTLKENKEEADIVRMVFDWYCNEGIGGKGICRRLESLHIKTKNNKDEWNASVIYAMLENVHYVGCVRWNWRKTIKIIEDSEIKKLRTKARINEYLIFEGKHEGIIPQELFDRALELRGVQAKTKIDYELKNPFAGIMFCKCGSAMGYKSYPAKKRKNSQPKLYCINQVHCKNGSVDFKEVVDYICGALEECIEDFEVRISEDKDDSAKLHKSLIESLNKKLKELEAKEIEQWDAQYHPDKDKRLPTHIFKKLNEKLLVDKAEINKALCKAHESMPQQVNYRNEILKFTDALNALKNDNVSAKDKNRYLMKIIDRIDYERPATVRVTKKNEHLYPQYSHIKGLKFHREPYTIKISLK